MVLSKSEKERVKRSNSVEQTRGQAIVGTASQLVDLNSQRRYKSVISRLESIPPLPTSAQTVLSILSKDPKDIIELEQAIRHDPSLASQLLKMANCALYAPRVAIDTVHRAIVFLGLSEVCNLALGLSILGVFRGSYSHPGLKARDFWIHSVATGILSRMIALELEEEDTEIFFTAGLLHDLGRMAMCTCLKKEWENIVNMAQEAERPLTWAERRIGVSHTVIGAWLAKTWNLPDIFVKAIFSHHLSPGHPKFNHVGAVVQLADYLAHVSGMGLLVAPVPPKSKIVYYLGLSEEFVEYMVEQLTEMEDIAESVADMMLLFGA